LRSSEADKPLRRIVTSFEELAAIAKHQPVGHGCHHVGAFAHARSNVSVLFGCLSIAFKFAKRDYVARHIPTPFPFFYRPFVSALQLH
jgi:hypothetical protein